MHAQKYKIKCIKNLKKKKVKRIYPVRVDPMNTASPITVKLLLASGFTIELSYILARHKVTSMVDISYIIFMLAYGYSAAPYRDRNSLDCFAESPPIIK